MAVRVVTERFVSCDNCGAEPAEQLTINLGSGPRALDLCPACQDVVGLPKLQLLLADYGVLPDRAGTAATRSLPVKNNSSKGHWSCPNCMNTYTTRGAGVSHLMQVHGMDVAQASHALPPKGDSQECPDCGYLSYAGTGLFQHVVSAHGQAAWTRAMKKYGIKPKSKA